MTKYNFGELLLTSIDADGICGGFDVELFEKVSKIVKIPIIACGGFVKLDHIKELKKFFTTEEYSTLATVMRETTAKLDKIHNELEAHLNARVLKD